MSENHETNTELQIDPETGFVTENPQPAIPEGPELESLTQVRDILVGPMSRDLAHGLANLEQRMEQTMRELAENTTTRLDELENRLAKEVTGLKTSLTKQGTAHSEKLEQAKSEHEAILNELRNKTEDLSEGISSTRSEFHDELTRQVQTLKDEIEQLSDKVANDLSGEAGRLRDELVDRASLAASLSEVVMRVSGPSAVLGPQPSEAEIDGLLDNCTDE